MARLHRQTRPFNCRTPLALALGLAFHTAHAQTAPAETQLAPVLVQGRATPVVTGAGWGDVPLSLAPMQAAVFGVEELKDRGVQRLPGV